MKLENIFQRRPADIHIGYVNYLECNSTFELVIAYSIYSNSITLLLLCTEHRVT